MKIKNKKAHRQDIQGADDFLKKAYFWLLINIIVIIPTWIYIEDNILHWLVALTSYALRGCIFPLFVLHFYRGERAFQLFLVVALMSIVTNLSDLQYIDKYDNIILFPKIVITLFVLGITIKKLTSH